MTRMVTFVSNCSFISGISVLSVCVALNNKDILQH